MKIPLMSSHRFSIILYIFVSKIFFFLKKKDYLSLNVQLVIVRVHMHYSPPSLLPLQKKKNYLLGVLVRNLQAKKYIPYEKRYICYKKRFFDH